MMTTVNWNAVLTETGVDGLRDFVNCELTRRDFESFGTESRKLVRYLGADAVRTRARSVLRRRHISV